MTSYLAKDLYSPGMVLAVGMLTSLALLGFGSWLLHLVRLELPAPWRQVTAMLLGILVSSLMVQVAAACSSSSAPELRALWGLVVATGMLHLVRSAWSARPDNRVGMRGMQLLPYAPAALAATISLLVAIAPSTRIDELYYHMLLPGRILMDGELRYYLEPWEAGILPQMAYQIALAPLHALGYPDAGNVVSWSMHLALLWFAGSLMRTAGVPPRWAGLWIAALAVGLHGVALQVASGSHAMGGLAMAAATVAFCMRRNLVAQLGPRAFCALVSILLLAAASSKLTLLPLAGVLLVVSCGASVMSADRVARRRLLATIAVPWLAFYMPLVVWTWLNSGSPFGPWLSWVMPWTVHDPVMIKQIIDGSRESNQGLPGLATIGSVYSPLVWIGVAGALTFTFLDAKTRAAAAGLLALQCALIYWLMPHDLRFLGGLPLGLAIVFAAFARNDVIASLVSRPAVRLSAVVLVVPWLAAQAYYAMSFVPVTVGLEPKEAFYERLVSFNADYRRLDAILPRDGVLLCVDSRLSAAYTPRAVFMDPRDLPKGRPVFLFTTPDGVPILPITGFTVGRTVYENRQALVDVYRTPYRIALVGQLKVMALTRD